MRFNGPSGLTRRQFVRHAAFAGFGTYVALTTGACRRRAAPPPSGEAAAPPAHAQPTSLTAAEFAAVSAVCDRLLPRDEDPGALDLGVPTYIDRAVASPDLAETREILVRLIPALDRQSRKRHGGKAFSDATPDEQDRLLAAWQRGAGGERRFFAAMLDLTLEGAFGDPKYGGNAGGRGFALTGFTPGPPMPKMSPQTPATPGMHHGKTPG